ncbi:MAG: purine-nucleoside phosphorylase [Candidatus Nanopelagicales bacterium]
MLTPYELARASAASIARITGIRTHEVAVVLGSGWGTAVDAFGATNSEVDYEHIDGFSATSVVGHAGKLRSVNIGADRHALVFMGRTHFYEGKGVDAVVHNVRTAAAAGARSIILTNAAGGLETDWRPGTVVLIADHINLTACSPITGANFIDLTDAYSPRLRALCRDIDPTLPEGVYAGLTGPHYETPAEIRYLGGIGAQLVGMSTVLETIAAREAGLEVLGVSLVTNLAAGLSGEPLNHEEVLEAGRSATARVGNLLAGVLRKM